MEIVVTELEDLADLSQLFDEYRVCCGQEHDGVAAKAFLRQRLERQDSHIWLGLVDEQVVGFVQLFPLLSSVSMSRQWVLNDLYVHPQARRQGVARGLVAEVIRFAEGTDSLGLVLETEAENVVAQQLYEKSGFIRERTLHYFYSAANSDK